MTPVPPTSTPKPTATPLITNITIDGNGDDWTNYPVNITDPTGDQKPGMADLIEARFFMNDKYLYLLIKIENKDKWDDMAFALGFSGNQNGQLNIRPSHHVDAGFYGTEFVDLPVSMEAAEVIELKIPLDRFPAKLQRIDFIRVFNHRQSGDEPVDDSQNGQHKSLSLLKETEASANADGSAYSGELTLDTTWSGEVHVSGDITLSNGVILTIEPGTTVYLASNKDDMRKGSVKSDSYIDSHQDPVGSEEWDQNAITIDGRGGTINAIGTAEQLITFRPEGDSASSAQWDGILIEKGTIRYAKVMYTGRLGILITGKTDGSPRDRVEIGYTQVISPHWGGIQEQTYNAWIHHNVVDGGGHQAMAIGSQTIAEFNVIKNCQNALFVAGVDSIVRNNIIVDCARGIQVYLEKGRIPAGTEIPILNNTIVQLNGPPDGWYYQGKLVYPTHAETWAISNQVPNLKLNIQNNIISGSFAHGMNFITAPGSGSVVDYNLFWGAEQNFNGNNMGDHNLFTDPLLTDDFRLRAGSPAINAGAPGMTDSDSSPVDLGAFGGDQSQPVSLSSAIVSTNTVTKPPLPTVTSTKPPTPTSIPLSTACQNNETQLFASDFESGTSGWNFNPPSAWTVAADDGSKVLQGSGHVHATHEASWNEVIWRLKVKIEEGRVHLNFHSKGDQRYLVSFSPIWTQAMKFPGGQTLQQDDLPHTVAVWHVVEVSLLNGRLKVVVDGVQEIDYAESAPLSAGGIWLETLEDSVIKFDDIHICQP